MDVVSDILRTIDLCGTVYFHADFRSPWGMQMAPGRFANFHLVTEGQAWVTSETDPHGFPAQAGDMVVFPHGAGHTITDARNRPPVAAAALLKNATETSSPQTYGGTGRLTKMICGHFEFSSALMHPLLATLPPMIHIETEDQAMRAWISGATELAAVESQRGGPGSQAVVDRLAEAVFVQILRLHGGETGVFMQALREPTLMPAIQAVHDQPAAAWTVEGLARLCHKSRSSFASAFAEAVGMSPMAYVTHWRMQRARNLLQGTDASLAVIAQQVGYESEWAFSKAFKRTFQTTPSGFRASA